VSRVFDDGLFGWGGRFRLGLFRKLATRHPQHLRFSFIDELPQWRAEGISHLLGNVQPQPHLAEFDAADVRAVNACDFGKLLLRQAQRLSLPTHNLAEGFADGVGHAYQFCFMKTGYLQTGVYKDGHRGRGSSTIGRSSAKGLETVLGQAGQECQVYNAPSLKLAGLASSQRMFTIVRYGPALRCCPLHTFEDYRQLQLRLCGPLWYNRIARYPV
jgi:hypothetical protein